MLLPGARACAARMHFFGLSSRCADSGDAKTGSHGPQQQRGSLESVDFSLSENTPAGSKQKTFLQHAIPCARCSRPAAAAGCGC